MEAVRFSQMPRVNTRKLYNHHYINSLTVKCRLLAGVVVSRNERRRRNKLKQEGHIPQNLLAQNISNSKTMSIHSQKL